MTGSVVINYYSFGFIFGHDKHGTGLGVFSVDVVGCLALIQSPNDKLYHIVAFSKAHTTGGNIKPGNEMFFVQGPNHPYQTLDEAGQDLLDMLSGEYRKEANEPDLVPE